MREKEIEKKLIIAVKHAGGMALKFISPDFDGVPDRLLLFPGGITAFVETKAPRSKMRPLQIKRMKQLSELGFKVYCIDRPEQIGGIIDELIKS